MQPNRILDMNSNNLLDNLELLEAVTTLRAKIVTQAREQHGANHVTLDVGASEAVLLRRLMSEYMSMLDEEIERNDFSAPAVKQPVLRKKMHLA